MNIQTFVGKAVTPHIPDLARLRMTVFRAFPYLYDGSAAYEADYLATYAASADSLFVLAIDGGEIVGASTGMPMADETDAVKAPFIAAGLEPARIFYFGESVLLDRHRGQGIGVRFFEEREAHARRLGRFSTMAFCAVERPDDHPARPEGYQPLHAFWRRRGFTHHPELVARFSWTDLGDHKETEKPLSFWLKDIAP